MKGSLIIKDDHSFHSLVVLFPNQFQPEIYSSIVATKTPAGLVWFDSQYYQQCTPFHNEGRVYWGTCSCRHVKGCPWKGTSDGAKLLLQYAYVDGRILQMLQNLQSIKGLIYVQRIKLSSPAGRQADKMVSRLHLGSYSIYAMLESSIQIFQIGTYLKFDQGYL